MTISAGISPAWLGFLRAYFAYIVVANLVWEAAQLPLYALWQTAPAIDQAIAVLHCTAGDVGIAAAALVTGLLIAANHAWPRERTVVVAVATVIAGLAYTVYSERLNVYTRQSWAYSAWMPVLPWIGVGLSPVAQWLILPTIGLAWARRRASYRREA
jgi:hypothetical protein